MDGMGDYIDLVYYGALLHDIGKFLWRIRSSTSFNHAKLGAEFVRGIKDKIKPFPIGNIRDNLATVIEHHHEKDLPKVRDQEQIFGIARLISFADKISASERTKLEDEDSRQLKNLLSVFSEIKIQRNELSCEDVKPSYFPFKKLTINPPVFPSEKDDTSGYPDLVDGFLDEYNRLISLKLNFDVSLLYLLQKYLWVVPSAYFYSKTDISLFEHLKTTAAIAISLYKEIGLSEKPKMGKPYWLLVIGDISGIQNFIYTISSKGAAKGLKGRSFYIELLQRAASRYLLDILELREANIIYMGGGKIYLLAYASAEEKLKKAEEEINKFLYKEFNGSLYFTLGWRPLTAENFSVPEEGEESIASVMQEIFDILDEKKAKKFSVILKKNYDSFFKPFPSELTHGICQVCGKELTPEELHTQEGILKCNTCKKMERIGSLIKNIKWITEIKGAINESKNSIEFKFGDYVLHYTFEKNLFLPNRFSISFRINDTEFIKEYLKDIVEGGDVGFWLIGGSKTFEEDRKTTGETFEDLVKNGTGAKKLGVFRADVDKLGAIFKEGLKERYSLARLSQLSFLIKYFFSGIINTIFTNNCRIIYSGGDDLFVVGHWNDVLKGVVDLEEKFKDFVRNPCITFSGGFVYVNPKYPIYSFSEMAGEEEEKAKSEGRNRFSGFGVVVRWEEFSVLKEIKDELLTAINEGLPKSYIQYLMRISVVDSEEERWRKSEKVNLVESSIRFYRWKWLLVYQHSRLKKKYKKHTALFEKVEEFLNTGKWDGRKHIEPERAPRIIYLPARWAELEIRKGGEE